MQECIEHYLSSTEHDFLAVAGGPTGDEAKTAVSPEETTADDAGSANETLKKIVNDKKLQSYIDTVKEYRTPNELSPAIAEAIKYIWENDPRLDGIFQKNHNKKVLDETTEFFWNSIDRISKPNYVPDKADIINVRYRLSFDLYINTIQSITDCICFPSDDEWCCLYSRCLPLTQDDR